MAEYTMHHLVIGENTYEIVDSVARVGAEAAFATDTASGSVASFSDGADDVPVKSLSVGIEPAQSGSGDPSPSNVRPISGWDSVKVFRTGKNLFDPTKLTTQSTWKDVKLDLPEGTYTMSDTLVEGSLSLYFILVGGTKSAATKVHSTHPVTLTISAGQKAQISFRRASGEDVFSNYTYQIEVGSTATDYEPYNGTVYDIDLPQTVYGGTLDVSTGELVIDHALVDLGTLTWTMPDSTNHIFRTTGIVNHKRTSGANYLCSAYLPVNSSVSTTAMGDKTCKGNSTTGTYLYVRNTDYSDVATFKTSLSGVMLCYEMDELQTLTLTPGQVTTLLGQNNIYADSGSVAVTYRADTGLYIDKRLNA